MFETRTGVLALVISLGAGCSLVGAEEWMTDVRGKAAGYSEERLEVGDLEVNYRAGGSGEPLMLVHGFGMPGALAWRRHTTQFAEGYRVIVPDLPGFGASHAEAPTVSSQADALVALMDHEGIDKADVVGASYGGFVLLDLAARHPERIRRAVFVASPGHTYSQGEYEDLLHRAGVESITDLMLPQDLEEVRRLLELVTADPPRLPRFMLRDLQENLLLHQAPARRACLDDLLSRSDGDLHAPDLHGDDILIIWGRQDELFPLATGERFAEATGGSLVVIEEAGHRPHLEQPDEFRTALSEYLNRRMDYSIR